MSSNFDSMPLANLIENRLFQGDMQQARIANDPDSKYAIFLKNDTFTVPTGVTEIYITACGGGGGGCFSDGGGGGGADAIVRKAFSVTPGEVIPLTIGQGGLGGQSSSSTEKAGKDGTATVVGNLITLQPGKGATGTAGGKAGGAGGGAGGVALASTATSNVLSYSRYGERGILGLGGLPGLAAPINTTTSPKTGSGGGGSLGCGGDGSTANLGIPQCVDPRNRSLLGGRLGQGTLANDPYSEWLCSGGGGSFGAGGGGGASGGLGSITVSNTKGGPGGQGLVMIEWF